MKYSVKNERFTLTADSQGAQLVSLKNDSDFEHIWTGDPAYWSSQAPVLFPIVGALRDGKADLDGFPVEMGQHGFARRREFSLAQQTEESLSFQLAADQDTRRLYPFDFTLTVTYTLSGDGYETRFRVENRGQGNMPFAIGGHPGYNLPLDEEAAFEDYVIRFEQDEEQDCPAIVEGQALIDPAACAFSLRGREIPLRHELFYHDALIFEGLRSKKIRIVNPQSGRGLEMGFAGFPMLGIWSAKNDGPYVCLEPWTGCATRTDEGDDFRKKHGMIQLAPGERFERAFTVRFF